MAKPLVDDALWSVIDPLLPPVPDRPKGGRPPVDNRKVLTGILFVLKTGIAWKDLPKEMNCGSGQTCWRRLKTWQAEGVWDRIHRVLLDRLRSEGKVDLSRAVVDSASIRALFGGRKRAPIPRIAAKKGANIIF